MTKGYHMIEKGLALPSPRPGFGVEATRELCEQIISAIKDDVCRHEVQLSVDALEGYVSFNEASSTPSPPHVLETISLARKAGIGRTGGPIRLVASTIDIPANALSFIESRASVREFAEEPVPREVLLNAARSAQAAPCVCNRQAAKIYFLTSEKDRADALHFQNGNRGFGDQSPVVAIITMDTAEMFEPTERYQHWIDGGLFAQNFLLAIHAQGYGACPLNWSAPITRDMGIRKLGYIKESESIIMMVAIGALKREYKVARSERRATSEIVRFVSEEQSSSI